MREKKTFLIETYRKKTFLLIFSCFLFSCTPLHKQQAQTAHLEKSPYKVKPLEFVQALRQYKIKTKKGKEVFKRLYPAIRSLSPPLKIKRIREGTSTKHVAVIGRKMHGNVFSVVEHFRKYKVPLAMHKDDKAMRAFQKRLEAYRLKAKNFEASLPDSEIQKSLMYQLNKKWIDHLIQNGYTVLDIGVPENVKEKSLFYQMEINKLFGEPWSK